MVYVNRFTVDLLKYNWICAAWLIIKCESLFLSYLLDLSLSHNEQITPNHWNESVDLEEDYYFVDMLILHLFINGGDTLGAGLRIKGAG